MDATPRTLHPTTPISKLMVITTSPPVDFTTSLMDNYRDGTREITRREEPRSLPLTTPAHNPGALCTPTSVALTTSPTDNHGDSLIEQEVFNAIPRANSKGLTNLATTSPTENYGDVTPDPTLKRRGGIHQPTLPPIPPTDNTGDARNQSAHFGLHGPGFLEAPFGPRRQRQLPDSNHPPPSMVRQVYERQTVIQSPGRWSARPRAASDPSESSTIQEPTMATRGVNL